jgi:hypothetical protein
MAQIMEKECLKAELSLNFDWKMYEEKINGVNIKVLA